MSNNTPLQLTKTTPAPVEDAYLVFIKFLMLSKHRVIELGSEYGLTAMQTLMLFLLDQPQPMHEIKKALNCDASNVTGLVDGLEQKELASRYASREDRRIKMVELSQHGRSMRGALLRQLGSQDSPLLSRLDPSEFSTFIGLLQKITQES
jgi:DNA-binding MarR family transcriptional regulator